MLGLLSPTPGFFAAALGAWLIIGYRAGWHWLWWLGTGVVALSGYVELVTRV